MPMIAKVHLLHLLVLLENNNTLMQKEVTFRTSLDSSLVFDVEDGSELNKMRNSWITALRRSVRLS
jgi:hypothetical protein